MVKPKPKFKCPWCGRLEVLTNKGALKPHLTAGGLRCFSAIPMHQWPKAKDSKNS
jgi:hypothetical protein